MTKEERLDEALKNWDCYELAKITIKGEDNNED